MPLRPVYRFDLSCDAKASAECKVRSHTAANGTYAVITAYDLKHAHELVRSQGWKVNTGKRGGQVTYHCPECQAFNARGAARVKNAPAKAKARR